MQIVVRPPVCFGPGGTITITILEVSMINGKRLEHGINEIFQQYEFENYKDALKYCQLVYKNSADPLEVEKNVKKYIQ